MIRDAMLSAVTHQSPALMVPWYLMSAYLYYHRDAPILSDGAFDNLCKDLHDSWYGIEHRHKYAVDRPSLTAGTAMMPLEAYPPLCINAADVLANITPLGHQSLEAHQSYWAEQGVTFGEQPKKKKILLFGNRAKAARTE